VALRRTYLYPAQVPTQASSPANRGEVLHEVLADTRVSALMVQREAYVHFALETPLARLLQATCTDGWQDVFPVLDGAEQIVGLITLSGIHQLSVEREHLQWMVAADAMQPPICVRPSDDLRRATELMIDNHLRELPVVDERGVVLGFLDEADITRSYIAAASWAEHAVMS
jgi:CBS domain-containing protein